MVRNLFATLLEIFIVGFALFSPIIVTKSRDSFLSAASIKTTDVLLDAGTEWMVVLCLGMYFVTFLYFRSRTDSSLTQSRESAMAAWHLIYVLFISAVLYAFYYKPSKLALTFLACATFGQGFGVLESGNRRADSRKCFEFSVVCLFVIFLSVAAFWGRYSANLFSYWTYARWTGPWNNPNVFGLLMGVGATLAVGLGMGRTRGCRLRKGVESRKLTVLEYLVKSFYFLAALLMGHGLLHSYSRGAWLGTSCGMVYLVYQVSRRKSKAVVAKMEISVASSKDGRRAEEMSRCPFSSRSKHNGLLYLVILGSAALLMFWHFRYTNWHLAQRVLSPVNMADFSWRNRVAAWEGTLQISAEHPWLGAGWNEPESLYEHYYLPQKLTESAAIEMNDYLLLGATLGIPALFCFAMYLWLSLARKAESRKQKVEIANAGWLQTTSRAGAIVLLVGFWFDGGLFKLPTAATFWILLELGNVRHELHE